MSIAWLLISLSLVMTLTGVGLDTAHLFLATQQVQNSADAAALAAARLVRSDLPGARAAAIVAAQANAVANGALILEDNPANTPDGDIVFGTHNRDTGIFTPTLSGPNAVLIRARRTADSPGGPVPLLLGAAVGLEGVDVVRVVVAMSTPGGAGAGLIALSPDGCGVDITGNGKINIDDGSVQVNSSSGCALCMVGNSQITAANVNVAGGACMSANAVIDGTLNTDASASGDPLADLPAPPIGLPMNPSSVNASANQTVNLQPGYYPGGIQVSGNATLNMAPGVYVIGAGGSGGFKTTGNGRVNADGVTLFLNGGALDLAGNGAKTINPPDPIEHSFDGVETYAGISIFQARTNTALAKIVGNGAMTIGGTVYLPEASLDLRGNGSSLGQQYIVDKLRLVGNANITVQYNGAFPIGTGSIFLVR